MEQALRQPKGLAVLFFAELWERFGFYCVQGLLVLYLIKKRHWGDHDAYDLFSAFSALLYATPVIGGLLADKFLGYRRAMVLGAVLFIIGYFLLYSHNPVIFSIAMAFLIWGNGFFKPNASTLLGKLYSHDDPRRDSGFTWFYMGINIGSFAAPLVSIFMVKVIGWHHAFTGPAIGMIFCLITCLVGFKQLGEEGLPPRTFSLGIHFLFYLLLIPSIGLIALLLRHGLMVVDTLVIIGGMAFLILLVSAFFESSAQRYRLIALIILMVFSILFWSLYVQTFSSLTLFTDRNVERMIFGYQVPAYVFGAVNPLFIIILAPFVAWMWLRLNQSSQERGGIHFSTPVKFGFALILMGLSFISLVLGMKVAGITALMGMGWLVLSYFLQTLGELSLSPIGLSAVTELAPPNLGGMVMGLWFLSLSAAYAVGGKIAELTAVPIGQTSAAITGPIYFKNFVYFGATSLAIGVVLMLLSPVINRIIHHE